MVKFERQVPLLFIQELAKFQAGLWDTVLNLSLPSQILKNVYAIWQDPPSNLMSAIGLIAWCSIHDLKEF